MPLTELNSDIRTQRYVHSKMLCPDHLNTVFSDFNNFKIPTFTQPIHMIFGGNFPHILYNVSTSDSRSIEHQKFELKVREKHDRFWPLPIQSSFGFPFTFPTYIHLINT